MTTIDPIDYALWTRDKTAFADALGRSFVETGFAIIDHHPVDQAVIDAAHNAAKDYFGLPEVAKRAYENADDGYQSKEAEHAVRSVGLRSLDATA